MARFRLRPPAWIVGGKGGMSVSGNLQYLGGAKALGAVLLGGTGRTRISGGITAQIPPPVGETWTVPAQSFAVGSGTTYDLKPTLPASLISGGTFNVETSGTPLPVGMTLTSDGILGVGTAAVSSAAGVRFGYTEPDALPVLTLHPTVTGTVPYVATVYPSEGAVPSGRFLVSPDDINLRSSTLSTWPDGSAQVMVVASRGVVVDNGVPKAINLRLNGTTDTAGTALTDARIAQVVSTITVNFSGTPQTLTLSGATKDWTWWANSEVICNRYRLSCGHGVMEAVIDIHAFTGNTPRAWVEVVIENGRVNANAADVVGATTQNYTNATVAVNGTTIATVSSKARGTSIRGPYNRKQNGTEVLPNANPEWTGIYSFALTPPGTPVIGRKYALGDFGYNGTDLPTGAWTGHGGDIAEWDGSQWVYTTGSVGQIVQTVAATGEGPYVWTGLTWTDAWAGGHEMNRAWYTSAQVVSGVATPIHDAMSLFGVEITHDADSMQMHPWFFKPCYPSTDTMSIKYGYQWSTYVPWSTANIRMPYMGGGGDDRHIGPLTEEQSDYIINSDLYSRRAVLATGLACLTADFSWRHDGTGGNAGRVPTRAQISGKSTNSNTWPETPSAPRWDAKGSHTPAVGVVPFLCRPSPCFIEIAQRDATWHAANYNSPDAARHRYDESRARGWRMRSYAAAAWLSPDVDYDSSVASTGMTRQESWRKAIVANLVDINEFLDKSWNTLRLFYGLDPDTASGPYTSVPRDNNSMFMDDYICVTWSMIEQIKVLRGADQTAWSAMLDKKDTPIRRINNSTAGEWRFCAYAQYCGPHIAGPPQSTDQGVGDFAERNRLIYGDAVPAATGPWLYDMAMNNGQTHVADWNAMFQITAVPRWSNADVGEDGGSYNFDAIRWAAFVRYVERGGAAADAAWAKVYGTVGATYTQAGSDAGITNFQTWRQGFGHYARWNMFPRNKV